jgi:hypothetical protein
MVLAQKIYRSATIRKEITVTEGTYPILGCSYVFCLSNKRPQAQDVTTYIAGGVSRHRSVELQGE